MHKPPAAHSETYSQSVPPWTYKPTWVVVLEGLDAGLRTGAENAALAEWYSAELKRRHDIEDADESRREKREELDRIRKESTVEILGVGTNAEVVEYFVEPETDRAKINLEGDRYVVEVDVLSLIRWLQENKPEVMRRPANET